MEKLSVADAASKLGISKEAIYNRIRRKTIKSVEEDGVKYVLLDNEKQTSKQTKRQTNSSNELIEYLKNEIEYLKLKNSALQQDKENLFREKESLYKEKENMLISSKEEIKAMYQERDKKLKYFLSLLERPLLEETDKVESKTIDVEVDDKKEMDEWVALKQYLDNLNLRKKERKEIKKAIVEDAYENPNVKIKAGMLYVNKNFDISTLKFKEEE